MPSLFRSPILYGVLLALVVPFALMTVAHVTADQLTVTVRKTAMVPRGLDDPVWQRIPEVRIPVQGRGAFADEEGVVQAKALYTNEALYFRLHWIDPTQSTTKQAWLFDGTRWQHQEGNEDRIALLFEVTRIHNFASRGCAITCHSPADLARDQWRFATATAEEKGDLWHWKAARSAPYAYADDAWLTVAGNPSGSYRETGRRKDAGEGGDVLNQSRDGNTPFYMQNPQIPPSAPGFLLFEEALEIKDFSIFKAGDTIPFRLPRKPSGSRFDVTAVSRYADGAWTVMLYRSLDTGHDDDVVFRPDRNYSFAIAVFDNSGTDHSKATLPLTLEFER